MNSMTKQTMHTQREDIQAQSTHEQTLSALIDGELSDEMAQQTIKRLGDNDAELARLADYLAIGDAMRGLDEQHHGFTRRVMAALENEPVVLAPMRKASNRRPLLWLAAAAVATISWGLWQSGPRNDIAAPLAALQQPARQSLEAQPYLAAHQDFAQAVVSAPEMRFSKASLEIRQ
jgi:anti-sigma factor RsiW